MKESDAFTTDCVFWCTKKVPSRCKCKSRVNMRSKSVVVNRGKRTTSLYGALRRENNSFDSEKWHENHWNV
ncbi:hypothetical protein WN55_10636 [Dufourea novaeangliae]|uniref:Uncharacterized protein n=1 Tax=Dufourea novaeangliae TaxID=178035 RepID=A0A154P4G8_DUFNO|nr:hypothetical protein WN55_10636 [Dufourea novaeangliae]